jgi:hypothetical protein
MGGWGNNTAHDNVIVGTDVPGDHSANAFFNGPSIAYNNYIKQVSSGFIVSYPSVYHDNHIEDVGPAYCNMPFPQYAGACTHENAFEDNADTGLQFYNNVITNVNAGLALWVAPNPGTTATLWNNVVYAVHDNQVIDLAHPVYSSSYCSTGKNGQGYCNNTGTFVLQNNTIECGDDTTQYDLCQSNVGFPAADGFVYENNHFITSTTAKGCSSGASNCKFDSTNVVQTLSTANGQGYKSSGTWAFSPAGSGGGTVGKGSPVGPPSSSYAIVVSSDTTYACTLGGGNSLTCPNHNPVPRTGAWDAGAYQYNSTATQPPSQLKATVTSPN